MTRIRSIKYGTLLFIATYLSGLVLYLGCRMLFGDEYWWLGLLNEFAWLLFLPLPISLGLSVLLRNRPVLIGNLLLTAVALVWFAPSYLLINPSPATTPTLKVVTFNTWGVNPRLDEVDAWLQEMEPDIVFLQEILPSLADNEVEAINGLFPYRASQTTAERMYGNLLLSRYPILSEENLPGEGVPAQHRFTLDINGRVVAVYNVHMAQPFGKNRLSFLPDSFITGTIFRYDNRVRNQEIRQLLSLIEREQLPFIVAGDFNMSDDTAIYQEISAVMIDSFREGGTGFGKSWPIRVVEEIPPFIPPILRVDYIWHSQDLRTTRVFRGPPLGSDHLPFFAEFEFAE